MSLDDRVNDACHRIEDLYNETDGHCYVSFSGGKDSTVLLALIKLCEEVYTIPQGGIPAVFSNTGIELGVTVDFVKWVRDNWYSNVQMIRPQHSFDWCLKTYGKPILSKLKSEKLRQWHRGNRTEALIRTMLYGKSVSGKASRTGKIADKHIHMLSDDFDIKTNSMCCTVMKKKPFKNYEKENGIKGAAVGLRMQEGGVRSLKIEERARSGQKICTYSNRGIIFKAPIVDWDDDDVEQFIKEYNVPLSKAYTEFGFGRTGCMGCPYALDVAMNLEYLFYHEPNRYKASMHWLKDVYIAQNVKLPFDESYERERERTWSEVYEPMRQEMLRKYRPNSRLIKDYSQTDIYEFMGGTE